MKKRMDHVKRIWVSTAVIFLLSTVSSLTAVSTHEPLKVRTVPLIDGRLDEEIWKNTAPLSDFLTIRPEYGKNPAETSLMKVAFDSDHLYLAFQCYDSRPELIKATMARRDDIGGDDRVGIYLDPFNDHQGGVFFVCNPFGVQSDGTLNVDGLEDYGYDMVWKSAGQTTPEGYTVEMAIPFKSLRFPAKKSLSMGIMATRVIIRRSEQANCPGFDPNRGSLLTQMREITLEGVRLKRFYEVLPAFTFSHTRERLAGVMNGAASHPLFSLTGKIGLTSELVLDAAFKPDFSQVESDAGQVDFNLRSAVFYPEKRPFFQEGMEHFAFGGQFPSHPLLSIVNTRTIIDPSWGVKLTGKIGTGNTLLVLAGLDQSIQSDTEVAAENTFFSILRYKRALKRDNYVGLFYTGIEREGGFNRVTGVDGRFRLGNASLFDFHVLGSWAFHKEAASPVSGLLYGLRYFYNTPAWHIETGVIDVGGDFRTDTGHLGRSNILMFPLIVKYSFTPKRSRFFQRIQPVYWSYHARDKAGNLWETCNYFSVWLYLPRETRIRLDSILQNEVFVGIRFPRNGFGGWIQSQLFKWLHLDIAFHRWGSIYYDVNNPYGGTGNTLSGGLLFQPSDQLSDEFSVHFNDFYRRGSREKIYSYMILRNRITFQFNRHLFVRGIVEYNDFRRKLTVDALASFTYIPGTVTHLGYGSAYNRERWQEDRYMPSGNFLEMKRGFFFKISYLFRF